MNIKRVSVQVKGRVQGVGFRFFTKDIARELGITGWVRNEFDRSVKLEAQGQPAQIDLFVNRLHDGPALARVSSVLVDDIPLCEGEKEFVIGR